MDTIPFTDAFLDYFLSNPGKIKGRINDSILAALVQYPEGGMLDSFRIATRLFEQLGSHSTHGTVRTWTQTKDYVQYNLRESDYICRHDSGRHGPGCHHLYRCHIEEQCSSHCNDKYAMRPRVRVTRPTCPTCFLMLPATGECGNCI